MTKKEKANIRYAKADAAMRKTTYKGLDAVQKQYIKAYQAHCSLDNSLSYFSRTAERAPTGAVDFAHMDDATLDYFDYIYKGNERALATMSRLSEIIDEDKTMQIFRQINTHSASF